MTKNIRVATDFAIILAGRDARRGPNNGARFRDTLLLPALQAGQDVEVDFTGVEAMTPSFLDEAFGTLVEHGYSVDELRRRLRISSKDDDVVALEIWEFIDERARATPHAA